MALKTPSPAPESKDAPAPRTAAYAKSTVRAWAIGLLLIPLLMFWLEFTEVVAEGPDLAAMSLPMAVLFALLVLIPINLAVKRFAPKLALNQSELMLIYTMNTTAICVGGIGMFQFLVPALAGWKYYATPENKWANWHHFLKPWAFADPSVTRPFFEGKTTFFRPAIMAGWAAPILVWSGFLLTMLVCFYCISVLMRRQWVERERLIFPIVQIPLEITQNGGDTPLWRNRLFWMGAGLPIVLESMAAVHFSLVPSFPYLPLKPQAALQIDMGITAPPWNSIGYTVLAFYPLVIGLTYLLSLDVSFSCWFFYLFNKMENVAATAWGFRDPGAGQALARIPYTGEQGVGAFLGLALFALWLAKPHLKATLRRAFLNDRSVDDSDEPLSYRAAWIGLIISAALLIGFGVTLGLSLPLALILFSLFLLLGLTFTRIRAEAGLPWGQGPGGLAHNTMLSFGGTQSLAPQEMTAFATLRWFDADWRCLPQASQMEAMKIGESIQPNRLNPRHLTAALLTAAVVGIFAAWGSLLGIYYHYGAASAHCDTWRTWQGRAPFDELQGWLNTPKPVDTPRIAGAGAGLAFVSLLSVLRTRFVWWPLHPIGYAVGCTGAMDWIWFPMLIGWLAKSLVLRYGGVKIYRQALPFFLGLVLGDYAISGLWALFFLGTGLPGYRTFPI